MGKIPKKKCFFLNLPLKGKSKNGLTFQCSLKDKRIQQLDGFIEDVRECECQVNVLKAVFIGEDKVSAEAVSYFKLLVSGITLFWGFLEPRLTDLVCSVRVLGLGLSALLVILVSLNYPFQQYISSC